MPRLAVPEGQDPLIDAWAGQAPALTVPAAQLSSAVYEHSTLPIREFESARITIARINDCQMCLGWRSARDVDGRADEAGDIDEAFYDAVREQRFDGLTEREVMAAEFADRFATDHLSMDDAFWDRLRAAWGPSAGLLPAGERLRLTLRATRAGMVSLLIEGGFSRGSPDDLLARVNGLESIWYRPGPAAATLVAGAPGLPERWGDETIPLGGTAFLQVNREGARLLEDHVLAIVGDPAGLRIVDAYCGVGLHARRLARGGADVVGIELDNEAVAAARAAAPARARFVEGSVEVRIADCLVTFGVVPSGVLHERRR